MYGTKANKADLEPVIERYLLARQYVTSLGEWIYVYG